MPSVQLNDNGVVEAVMSFDAVAPNQITVPEYDGELMGKRHENGLFVEVQGADSTELMGEHSENEFSVEIQGADSTDLDSGGSNV